MRAEPGASWTCSPLWSNQEAVGHRGMLIPHCVEFGRPLRTSTNTALGWWYMSIHKPSTEQTGAGDIQTANPTFHMENPKNDNSNTRLQFEKSDLVWSLCHYLRTSSSLGHESGSVQRHGSSLEMDIINMRTCVFTPSLMRLRWNFVGLAPREPLILPLVT